jgi:hypothetical protein
LSPLNNFLEQLSEMFGKNWLSPILKLLNDENEIVFTDEEKRVFENRDQRSLFTESLHFWPGNSGVHHANG